jgi:CDP-glucose 4,6-dehydratase
VNNFLLKNFWKKKRVLVTGHTGFKGSWLCFILKEMGAKVYGYSLKAEHKFGFFNQLNIKKKIDISYIADVNNETKLFKFISSVQPQIIFHLAAQSLVIKSFNDPINTFKTNIIGSINVLHVAKKIKSVKAILITTTDKVYENKENINGYKENDPLGGNDNYSASKASAEIVINSYRNSYFRSSKDAYIATVRSGNVIGGGDWSENRLIPDIIKSIQYKKLLKLRNPNSIRPWQHILDCIYGYLILSENLFKKNKKAVGAWNLGPDNLRLYKVKEIVYFFKKKFKNFKYTFNKKSNFIETKFLTLNNDKIRTIFKWKPKLNMKNSLKLTFEWYKFFLEKKDLEKISKYQINNFFND